MRIKLSANLNAVAMLRNRRDVPWPSVTEIGAIALEAGADGLTAHPRPDQRHIRYSDIPAIRALVDDGFPGCEFNIEGYPTEEFVALCIANEPDQVTLVPDDPSQSTSDHGWNFAVNQDFLRRTVGRLRETGIRVSLFCDPDAATEELEVVRACGAQRIELYTGPYGACHDNPAAAAAEVEKLAMTAQTAQGLGLAVNAGHDLTVANLPALVGAIPDLAEVSIGHALTAEALIHGFGSAVKRFLAAMQRTG